MKRIAMTALLLLILATPSTAAARPTLSDAHLTAHYVLDDYADLIDGKVWVAGCVARGRRSVVCSVRIVGPVRQRFRLVVSQASGSMWLVRARPLP